MTENPLKELLPHGAIGFPVTPFHQDFSLDLEGFSRNLEIVLAKPFTAFVAAGGTGELYSLARDEYLAVVRAAVDKANGQMPVIAGVGRFPTLLKSWRLNRKFSIALLILPPYCKTPV